MLIACPRWKHTTEGAKIVVTLYYIWGVPCLNFNHVIITKCFHNVLHIMVGQNPKKSKCQETIFFISYDVMLKYIYAIKIYVTKYWKLKIYSRNDWNDFEFLWNLKYLLNIVIPYDWNKFMNCRKSLIIIISLINFFKVMTICMVNKIFDKQLFSNKRLEEIWGGKFLKIFI
jgi:hypothetical protein